jgi:MoxR-like ATPase
MVEIRLAEAAHEVDHDRIIESLYSREILIERPLLQALTQAQSPVLLIDELDRADEPLDAFLLEVLAESQITIPELGTVRAEAPPFTLITSNRTREVHDALKRRCLFRWVEFPDVERELQIVRLKAPGASERLYRQEVEFVQRMCALDPRPRLKPCSPRTSSTSLAGRARPGCRPAPTWAGRWRRRR